jgi:hypothetical protein
MKSYRFTAVIILLILIGSASMPTGTPALVADTPSAAKRGTPSVTSVQNAMGAAAKEENAAEVKNPAPAGPQDLKPESGSTQRENGGQPSNDEKTTPLKPFVPSEKIPAEQAVDFPADI